MGPVAYQLEQRGHPGLERVGRQADETGARRVAQIDKGRNVGLAGGRVARAGGRRSDQLGQPGQDVVALAVDFHAQRQLEPGRRRFVIALRLQLHGQRLTMRDPAVQGVVQRQRETGFAQHGKTVVGPVQPVLLRPVGRNAEHAAVAGGGEPEVHQARDGAQLGFGVALQQHAALRAVHQHRQPLAGPPAAMALIVKAQLRLDQPLERDQFGRRGR